MSASSQTLSLWFWGKESRL